MTDYLEDELPSDERARFDSHISGCDPCRIYLNQLRATLDLLGRLGPELLEPDVERRLLHVFRSWKAQAQPR